MVQYINASVRGMQGVAATYTCRALYS
jgi:hypothetical protein